MKVNLRVPETGVRRFVVDHYEGIMTVFVISMVLLGAFIIGSEFILSSAGR